MYYTKVVTESKKNCKRVHDWIKMYSWLLISGTIFGIAVFFLQISQSLVNSYDGIWNTSVYFADYWERSIGRWFWPYLDKLRFGTVSVPLNSILTLILAAIASAFLVDLFQVKKKGYSFLVCALFTASPLMGNSLSYGYMSPTFGMAYLLAVLSMFCAIKVSRTVPAILAGIVFLAFSMGCYQSYFGAACIVALIWMINKLFQDVNWKEFGNTLIRIGGTLLGGGLLYKILLDITLKIYQMDLSDYRGANEISITNIILNLPREIKLTYGDFYRYFFTDFTQNTAWIRKIYLVLFVVCAVWLLYKLIKVVRMNIVKALLAGFFILCVPIACNATLIITVQEGSYLLMAGGMTLFLPLLLCIMERSKDGKALILVNAVLMCAVLWVNICIVNNDQVALQEGRSSTYTLARSIADRVQDEGWAPDGQTEVLLVGRPSENPFFKQTNAWKRANDYATFGRWWVDPGNNRKSWQGVFDQCGIQLLMLNDYERNMEVLNGEKIKEMECFPSKTSISVINDIVVVKVSEGYVF